METTNVVAVLLFVLPGILAEKISYRMDFPSAEKRSDFRELLNGILLSLPIVSSVGLGFAKGNNISKLKDFIAEFEDLKFLFSFTIIIFLVAIIFGVIKGLSKDIWIKVVNFLRNRFDKMNIDDKGCWRKIFLDDVYTAKNEKNIRYPKYIVIEKDGNTEEGFALCYSLPNEELEIAIEKPENLKYYPNYKDYLTEEKIYYNLEKGIIIKAYDTQKLNEYFEEIKSTKALEELAALVGQQNSSDSV